MIKVSAIIPTYNEEHNIAEAIASVNWCDEIIVVDSFSSDRTIEIAKELGAKVFCNTFKYFADQKNWAIPKAENEWIILLDADERVSEKLKAEIIQKLHQKKIDSNAFWINRENYFLGKKINYSGWQNDRVIRFFNRDTCRYKDVKVHEEIITDGTISELKNKIIHNTYKDFNHYMDKVNSYTTLWAKDNISKTKKVTFFHLWIKPSFRFIKHYFFKLGILDGQEGFVISKLSMISVFLKYAKLNQLQKGEEI